jgi:hypothetical protein
MGNHQAVGCVFPHTSGHERVLDYDLDTRRVMICYVKYVEPRRLLFPGAKNCQSRVHGLCDPRKRLLVGMWPNRVPVLLAAH